jgi:hypothetical protein
MENQRMIDVDRGRLRPTSEDIIRLMVERGNIVIHEDRHE